MGNMKVLLNLIFSLPRFLPETWWGLFIGNFILVLTVLTALVVLWGVVSGYKDFGFFLFFYRRAALFLPLALAVLVWMLIKLSHAPVRAGYLPMVFGSLWLPCAIAGHKIGRILQRPGRFLLGFVLLLFLIFWSVTLIASPGMLKTGSSKEELKAQYRALFGTEADGATREFLLKNVEKPAEK